MGTIFSLFAPLRSLVWLTRRKYLDYYGRAFVDMIRDHLDYGPQISEEINYEIKLQSTSGHHWRLLVRKLGNSSLPYVSMEITTVNMKDLINVMRNLIPGDCEDAKNLGPYHGSLLELCKHADAVVEEMKSYNLFGSNCQTFCNGVLRRMGKDELPTTNEKVIRDLIEEILPPAVNVTKKEVKLEAKEFEFELDNVTRKPSSDDLKALVGILVPIESRGEDIGKKLLGNSALNVIKYTSKQQPHCCLHQMLKTYLSPAKHPSWKQLVNAIKEYNMDVARAVAKLANTVQQPQAESTEETGVFIEL